MQRWTPATRGTGAGAARDWLASLGPEDDEDWPAAMAAHALRLATARARAAQARLAGPDTWWRA